METIHPVYLRTLKDLEKDEYGLYIHTPGYKKIRNGIDKSHGKINKMVESKRYPKPPAPPPPRKIMEGINYRKEFLKFWKWLKYWFTPKEPSISMKDIFNDGHYITKTKVLESDQIKRTQKLSYVLRKATREVEQLGKALKRMDRRKKRYSISTPIIRLWK